MQNENNVAPLIPYNLRLYVRTASKLSFATDCSVETSSGVKAAIQCASEWCIQRHGVAPLEVRTQREIGGMPHGQLRPNEPVPLACA